MGIKRFQSCNGRPRYDCHTMLQQIGENVTVAGSRWKFPKHLMGVYFSEIGNDLHLNLKGSLRGGTMGMGETWRWSIRVKYFYP